LYLVPRASRLAPLLLTALPLLAAPIDETKLPPAATNTVDFLRDIKPILDTSCLKCHGPEKPKSRFRVGDRAALLKGGDTGVAVIPGQSAKSPLIHYVARLVPEMEMPPDGKGDPLTPQQIALLRAWIDQDLPWSGVEPSATTVAEVAPTLGWINVDGDKQKFRELNWMREGWNGGFENFLLQQQLGPDKRFTLEGHALLDDYKVTLALQHSDGRFVRAGFEQFRKYYDDSGGYHPSAVPPQFSLGSDLHLDLGKAWIEAGGITPFGLQLTGGYEYLFKEGEKSSTSWLPVDTAVGPRSMLPVAKAIDEHVHVLRLDAGYELAGFRFDDNFRYEFYDLKTRQTSTFVEANPPDPRQILRDQQQSQNLANAFKVEKQALDWLLVSAGYLYTRSDGDTAFGQTPVNAAGQPVFGILWNGEGIALEQSAHIFNANAQFGIWEQMTLSAGLQTEWNRQRVFGGANLDFGDPTDPINIITNRARIEGEQGHDKNVGDRFGPILAGLGQAEHPRHQGCTRAVEVEGELFAFAHHARQGDGVPFLAQQVDQRRGVGLFPDRHKGRNDGSGRQGDGGDEVPRHAPGCVGRRQPQGGPTGQRLLPHGLLAGGNDHEGGCTQNEK